MTNANNATGFPLRLRSTLRARAGCALVGVALLTSGLAGCGEREPELVCDRLGSFHRLSRDKLERVRIAELSSLAEWECMADALAQLDRDLTTRCKTTPEYLDAVLTEQRDHYRACLVPPRNGVVERALVRSLPGR